MKPEIICHTLCEELVDLDGLYVAILYGSSVTGRLRPESDIDLGVLFDHTLTSQERLSLVDQLTQTLDSPIDLVDLSMASGVILQEILCNGKVLLNNDMQSFVRLIQRMVYEQEDLMPYCRRALHERIARFAHG